MGARPLRDLQSPSLIRPPSDPHVRKRNFVSVAASVIFWPDDEVLFDVRFSLTLRIVVRPIERAPAMFTLSGRRDI